MLTALSKSFLVPLGLTTAAPATDLATHKKVFGSEMSILIIPSEEMQHIMKIVELIEVFGLLIKDEKQFKMN